MVNSTTEETETGASLDLLFNQSSKICKLHAKEKCYTETKKVDSNSNSILHIHIYTCTHTSVTTHIHTHVHILTNQERGFYAMCLWTNKKSLWFWNHLHTATTNFFQSRTCLHPLGLMYNFFMTLISMLGEGYTHTGICTCHSAREGQRKLQVSSLLPPCGAQGLNTGQLGGHCLYFWSYLTGPNVEFLSIKEPDGI